MENFQRNAVCPDGGGVDYVKILRMSDEKPKKYKPRVPPWLLGGMVLILFTFLVLLQSSNYWKSLTVDSASDTLLLYALSSLNYRLGQHVSA